MTTFWISWYATAAMSEHELHAPLWISGSGGFTEDTSFSSICAAVRAPTETAAHEIVYACYGERPARIEFRFCEERPNDWEPYSSRFGKRDWMPDWSRHVASGKTTHAGPLPDGYDPYYDETITDARP